MSLDADLTLLYKFADNKSLVPVAGLGPTLGCVRALASATYFDSSGVMQMASADTARFDHLPVSPFTSLGLLHEETSTNKTIQSGDFGNAAWTWPVATHAASAETCPDGSTDAEKLIETGATSSQFRVQTTTGMSAVTGVPYVWSVYIKPGTRTWCAIQFNGAGLGTAYSYFNLTGDGAVGFEGANVEFSQIEKLANGWYRCIVAPINSLSTATIKCYVYAASADNTAVYDGVNNDVALHIWGGQCEQFDNATSYIPTTTVAVTRNSDVVSTSTMGWHDQLTGTYYAEYTSKITEGVAKNQTVLASPVALGDTTPMAAAIYLLSSNAHWHVKDASGDIADATAAMNIDGTLNRSSGAYSLNDFQGYVNGAASAHDTAGTPANTAHAYFAVGSGGAGGIFTGHIKEVRFYDVRKIDTFLADLSNGLIDESAPIGGGSEPLIIFIGLQ